VPPVKGKDWTSVVSDLDLDPFACASPNVLQSSTIATSNGLNIFVITNTHVNLDFILDLLLILLLVRKYQLSVRSTSGAYTIALSGWLDHITEDHVTK